MIVCTTGSLPDPASRFLRSGPSVRAWQGTGQSCPGSSADGPPGLPVSGPGHTYPPSPGTARPGGPPDHARHRRLLVQQGQDRLVVRVRCKGAGRQIFGTVSFLRTAFRDAKYTSPSSHAAIRRDRARAGRCPRSRTNEKRAPGWRAAISITWLHTESTVVGSSVRCLAGIPSESARSCARVIPFRNATFAARSCVVSPSGR